MLFPLPLAGLPALLSLASPVCPRGDMAGGELGDLVVHPARRTLTVADGVGTLVIEREFENTGDGPATATVEVGGGRDVVVDATLRFTRRGDTAQLRRADLDEAAAAAQSYDDYLEALEYGVDDAGDAPPEPALLVQHNDAGGALVAVAGPCSVRRIRVTTTLRLASEPWDGAWRFHVADAMEDDHHLRVRAGDAQVATHPFDEQRGVFVDVRPAGTATRGRAAWVPVRGLQNPVASPARNLVDADEPDEDEGDDADLDARSADGLVHDDVVALRAELDLPDPLVEPARGQRFVFVVDTSRSAGTALQQGAWRLIRHIAAAAPADATGAVVTFARHAAVTTPRALLRALSPRDVPLHNGSDVLEALALAQRQLDDLDPDVEVGRIVLITDLQITERDEVHLNTALMAQGDSALRDEVHPVLHVVQLIDGGVGGWSLERSYALDDESVRLAAVEQSGGAWLVARSAGAVGEGGDAYAAERPWGAYLVAPNRLERPRLTVDHRDVVAAAWGVAFEPVDGPGGLEHDDESMPANLWPGGGLRAQLLLPPGALAPGARVVVQGQLWGKTVAIPLRSTPELEPLLLGLMGQGKLEHVVGDDIVRGAAVRAHAVSRMTSLQAVPTWRAPVDPELGLGRTGWGGCGCGGASACHGFGTRCGIGGVAIVGEQDHLQRLLREDAAACGVDVVEAEVEVWEREILDVRVRAGGTCVSERFWARDLEATAATLDPRALLQHKTYGLKVELKVEPTVAPKVEPEVEPEVAPAP